MKIPKDKLPAFVRNCWERHKTATEHLRAAEKERLNFYVGGELQWRDKEREKRKAAQRPIITINRCKPAVDQIEGDIRMNPPGPEVLPIGSGADEDTADIMAGLIREVEFRSDAKTAYVTAGKYSAASGYAVIELSSEYVNERSYEQRLCIESVEDPATVFFDPDARMANRQDAMWAGKMKRYSREQYIAKFGTRRKVLEGMNAARVFGWIQDAMGAKGEAAQVMEWTNGGAGPFYVCEFYMVEFEKAKLKLYSDNIARFDDEEVPEGVTEHESGTERVVNRRKICKYIVDALEAEDDTDWMGRLIPLFPVLGPEVYIDGRLYRLSAIAGAIDPQRALNYVATTATELAGAMPKSPWIGPKGTFDDLRWETANTEMWAYLEYVPVWVTDQISGARQLAPAPQRNQWEAPIQWLLALGAYFADSIKAVTSIYDPSLGQQTSDQSGKAIQQLRSESSVATFSYADNLHRTVGVIYNEMIYIFPKMYDGERVVVIVKPDNQHEMVTINRIFGEDGIDKATGKKGKRNDIQSSQHAVRAIAGPSFETRQLKAVDTLTQFFKVAPQTLAVPGVAAQFLHMIADGNPKVVGMADLLQPAKPGDEQSPAQLSQALQQAQQQNQVLTMLVQKLHQAIQGKLPELEFKRWQVAIETLGKIRVAEITASKDADRANADRAASMLESIIGNAHDTAQQAVQLEHERGQQTQQLAAAAAQPQNGTGEQPGAGQ